MRTIDWTNYAAAALHYVDALAAIDPERLLRRDFGGDQTFQLFEDDFTRIRAVAVALQATDFNPVPGDNLRDLATNAELLDGVLKQIAGLDAMHWATRAEAGTITTARNAIIQEMQNRLPAFYNSAAFVFAYSLQSASSRTTKLIQGEFANARVEITATMKAAEDSATRIAALEKEMRSFVETGRNSLEELGVGRHAKHFQLQAQSHVSSAQNWLGATVLSLVATAGFGVWNYVEANNTLKTTLDGPHVTQLVAAKIIIFSLLASVTVWCGRAYRAHRHNEVVNRHRQNALSSFEAFVSAADGDAETKNAVLLEATRSIFSQQPTGYAPADDSAPGGAQVLEIFRSLPNAKS